MTALSYRRRNTRFTHLRSTGLIHGAEQFLRSNSSSASETFLTFSWKQKCHYFVHKHPPFVSLMSLINTVHTDHPISLIPNLVLPPVYDEVFEAEISCKYFRHSMICILLSPMHAVCRAHHINFYFTTNRETEHSPIFSLHVFRVSSLVQIFSTCFPHHHVLPFCVNA